MGINLVALVEYKKEEIVYLSIIFHIKQKYFGSGYVKNSMESYRLDLLNCFLLKAEIRNVFISTFLYFFFPEYTC